MEVDGEPGRTRLQYAETIDPHQWPPDPNHVVSAVNTALTLDRHRRDAAKLNRSGAHERHLFFWVGTDRADILVSVGEEVPTRQPHPRPESHHYGWRRAANITRCCTGISRTAGGHITIPS
jgi:hypothetical protein